MRFSKKHQVEGDCLMIGEITMCPPLQCVSTKKVNGGEDEGVKSGLTTPKKELSLPRNLECPPAPRKRKPVLGFKKSEKVEFFTSPELDLFFKKFANGGKVKSSSS